ncbi:MAG TPA: metalloregulator ArsR/SmtB family transcription factor [Anaerolineales bacterium]|nr:metalloregulator ArsR/SmtB family transcription factor [Anaerolineales bacterium]
MEHKILDAAESISKFLNSFSRPNRIAVLLAIGKSETCVCQLSTILGWKQAYLSQHLMALKKSGIISDRRSGKYVYYRLTDPSLLDHFKAFTSMVGLPTDLIDPWITPRETLKCECDHNLETPSIE